eukprot:CAMPEP_0113535862 /NCGR_PEP_ID=MMETSP0015_2-20120614/5943_1 /TAXON_ID=2838 /ORGANISM="Odontella" /LENGTH=337 /DNA_ID=CAMNT_0000435167 /DNA_START=88 /DNA_END=1101 /DNA_ORIENTATION=- /assembly_acc=CAM_ASM_000160
MGISASFSSPSSVLPKAGIENKLVTTSTDPPFHMFVYPTQQDKYISHNIATKGIYEPPTTELIYKLIPNDLLGGDVKLKKHYVAVDLGSNLGYYSLLLASRGMHVISFEASPDSAWLQRSSAALNGLLLSTPTTQSTASDGGSVTIIDRGVTDKPSTGRLSRHSDSPGMTSFSAVDKFDLQKGAAGTPLDVDIQLVRAGDMLKELGIIGSSSSNNETPKIEQSHNLHLLKIDVEGFELKALKGLDLDQYKFRHILMEYFPDMLRGAGTDPPQVLLYILSHGYKFYEIVGRMGELRKIDVGDNDAKGLRDWAEMAEKMTGDGFHVNLFASVGIEDLEG